MVMQIVTDEMVQADKAGRYIYPLTIVGDRYGGVYSKGAYTAWNRDSDDVPIDIDCDDNTCMDFWKDNDIPVGIGNTPDEAMASLCSNLRAI